MICEECRTGVVIDAGATRCRKCRAATPDAPPPAVPPKPALSRIVKAFEDGFDAIRRQHPEVPHFVVVVATGQEGKAGVTHWGHFMARRWRTRLAANWDRPGVDTEDYAEVKISAEGLGRPVMELWETMLHEVAHVLADLRGIKDTSDNGRYHNERFVYLAQEVGLTPPQERHPRYGYAFTAPNEQMLRARYGPAIDKLEAALTLYRREDQPAGSKERESGKGGKRVTVVCECERRFLISPSVLDAGPIICGVCGKPFADADAADPRDSCEACAELGDACLIHGAEEIEG